MPFESLTTTQYRLTASGVTTGYSGASVVHNVSAQFPDGSITAILGPNGCGKSTFLKALARVIPVSTGQVRLDGQSINAISPRQVARRLALLPQGPIAPEGLRVRELVAQGRHPHRTLLQQWSRDDARAVETAMQAADIVDLADKPVSALSGGQRQRCWIAMVLAQETDLLLLDEPTTFLDLKVQIDLMQLLRRICHEQGRTLVVVLHELNLAAAFADHLMFMKDGRIAAQGGVAATFTAETLSDVFGLRASISIDPVGGHPVCMPIIDRSRAMVAS